MTVASAIFSPVSAAAEDQSRRERVHTVETIGVEVVDSAPLVANAPLAPNVVPFASTLRRVG
jgi:hypothetical protein